MSTPYTYLIGWSKLDKFYYGVRYAKTCIPDDLWVRYFTSSKLVKHYRNLYGEPDIIQVRRTFNDKVKAADWEAKVLRRLKIKTNEKMLNSNIAGAIVKCMNRTGPPKGNIPWNKGKIGIYSQETLDKISRARIGKPAWNKGLPNSTSAENGRKGAAKLSSKVQGRKIATREDGSRYWVYPNKSGEIG